MSQKLFRIRNLSQVNYGFYYSSKFQTTTKVPSLKEVNFGKVKLWAVEHFWTDFDLRKRRDKKMDQISD